MGNSKSGGRLIVLWEHDADTDVTEVKYLTDETDYLPPRVEAMIANSMLRSLAQAGDLHVTVDAS